MVMGLKSVVKRFGAGADARPDQALAQGPQLHECEVSAAPISPPSQTVKKNLGFDSLKIALKIQGPKGGRNPLGLKFQVWFLKCFPGPDQFSSDPFFGGGFWTFLFLCPCWRPSGFSIPKRGYSIGKVFFGRSAFFYYDRLSSFIYRSINEEKNRFLLSQRDSAPTPAFIAADRTKKPKSVPPLRPEPEILMVSKKSICGVARLRRCEDGGGSPSRPISGNRRVAPTIGFAGLASGAFAETVFKKAICPASSRLRSNFVYP
jgi:hypothetical protein